MGTQLRYGSPEVQGQVIEFIESLRENLGSRGKWQEACERADISSITAKRVDYMRFPLFTDLVQNMPPGHDQGHVLRDLINAVYITSQVRARYQADKIVGMVAGIFHDVGNGVDMRRYDDRKYAMGHAEVGAYIFWHRATFIEETARSMIAYCIAAHTHYLKPLPTEVGYNRLPYFDELWEENNQLVGVGYRIPRIADRIDTNGITHLVREMLAQCDAAEGGGADITVDEWVEINEEKLHAVFSPYVRTPAGKPPTTFEHCLSYLNSNFGKSAYSVDDHRFKGVDALMRFKADQLNKVIAAADGDRTPMAVYDIRYLLYKMSRSSVAKFEEAWKIFSREWNLLGDVDKARWGKSFAELAIQNEEYLTHLRGLKYRSPYRKTADETAEWLLN